MKIEIECLCWERRRATVEIDSNAAKFTDPPGRACGNSGAGVHVWPIVDPA